MSSCALVLVALATLLPQEPAPVAASGVAKTARFEIRFRPGSRAEASVDRVAALVEGDLDLILRELGLEQFPYTIRLWLYDDVADLQRTTGVPSAGHSSPLESHVPHDNDQTRLHELVHVVAEKFAERGDEARNLFFAEGLANAVLRFVSGVHVDAVAAFYQRRGELPALAAVHAIDDFYAWLRERPGLNAYDIAGSWMRFLLDVHGPAKVRRYYKGAPVEAAFGADLAALEQAWHARLAQVRLRPGLEALLRERAGGPPAAERNAPEARLSDAILGPGAEWRELAQARIADGDPAKWQARAGTDTLALSGVKSQGDWCVARLAEVTLGDAIVRCQVVPLDGCYGAQVQLGPSCQAIVLRGQGTFVYTDKGGVGHDPRTQLGDGVEIVFRRRQGKASIWVDGKLVAEGPVPTEPGLLGFGCVGGGARFTRIAVRELK